MSDKKKTNEETSSKVKKIYNCPVCKKTHMIELPSNLADNRKRYPFPYVFIHSSKDNKNDIVSMLYIDKDLQIRGSEAVKLEESKLVSKNVTQQLVSNLTDIIMNLEDENFKLKNLVESQDIEDLVKEETKNLRKALLGDDSSDKEKISDIKEETVEDSDMESFQAKNTLNQPNMRIQKSSDLISEKKAKGEETTEVKVKKPEPEIPPEIRTKVPKETQKEGIAIYCTSTIGPQEKTQKLIVKKTTKIAELKITIGELYGLNTANFHLSCGGLTLSETRTLTSYNISQNNEILIIPSSTAGFMPYNF